MKRCNNANETLVKIFLYWLKDMHVDLVNKRSKNHDGFKFIHDAHDGKVNDQYYEDEREYEVPNMRKSS